MMLTVSPFDSPEVEACRKALSCRTSDTGEWFDGRLTLLRLCTGA
jgi:hypothetical protein